MKLQDISVLRTDQGIDVRAMSRDELQGNGKEQGGLYREMEELIAAREAGAISSCKFLAQDELELANFILRKVDVDPAYRLSMTLLQAIRSINAKLALCAMPSIPSKCGKADVDQILPMAAIY